jgi:hypothetical protein
MRTEHKKMVAAGELVQNVFFPLIRYPSGPGSATVRGFPSEVPVSEMDTQATTRPLAHRRSSSLSPDVKRSSPGAAD